MITFQHSVIMADFIVLETQKPIIIIILIIYSPYLLKDLVDLNLSGRIASYYFQFLRNLQAACFLSSCWSVELDHAFYYVPCT